MTTPYPSALGSIPPMGPEIVGYAHGPDDGPVASSSSATLGSGAPPTVFLSTSTPNGAYLTPATYQAILNNTLALHTNPSAILTYESRRQQACGLIAAVGARVGLPQRTVSTAFVIWQKCGVNRGAPSGTSAQQVALAALFLACKLNDTPKKARDLIVASYAIRYPDLVKLGRDPSSSASGAANRREQLQQLALASVQESDVDAQMLDSERNKVLSLERTLLEEFGYDFKIRHGVESVSRGILKLGRAWGADKDFIQDAWQLASDVHRTSAPLLYPPIILSLSALLTASLLCPRNASASRAASALRIRRIFGLSNAKNSFGEAVAGEALSHKAHLNDNSRHGEQQNGKSASKGPSVPEQAWRWAEDTSWELKLRCFREEIEEVTHSLLDLYLSSCSAITSAQSARSASGVSPTSPSTTPLSPASPSEYGNFITSSAGKKGSSGASGQSLRLPAHTFNPPPFGVISWLHAHSATDQDQTQPRGAADLARTLTDCKIELRGAEDLRKRQDEEARTKMAGSNGANLNGNGLRPGMGDLALDQIARRLARRAAIEQEKARVQTVKVEVQTVLGEGEDTTATTVLLPTTRETSGSAATPSATMSLTLTPLYNTASGQDTAAVGAASFNGRAVDDSQLQNEGGDKSTVVTGASGGKSGGSGSASARSYKTSRFLF
ncbi:hypothetical protein BCV69DRAFT_313227 [Microstroma glucosiphilum]|uniref:Cyclin N-terminal domain-containing protein n=1 Tax=Pseudomicrostroma glucosiphilum TaxID=1684307 RepID=A0A316U5A9_9BASI|nr:hypothetical protein BCV69DRAFT_313227 [Pseudomicrostroma glucosiphilum]PWN20024.1 hypothetical protein BCV69DRAFT_313227 [Pseudomicrostroma glucosiphilum]